MSVPERMTVHVVLSGHVPKRPDAFVSLDAQTERSFRTLVADHGATDGGRPWITQRPDFVVIRRKHGQDTVRAQNDLLALTSARWEGEAAERAIVLFLGQDVWLEADALEKVLAAFDADQNLSMAGVPLAHAQWTFDEDDERHELIPLGTWEEAGWELTKSRRLRLRLHGQPETEPLPEGEVFGFSLRALAIRVSALHRLRADGVWFDEALSPELAAADLAWRGKVLGMRTVLVPSTKGWVRPVPAQQRGTIQRIIAWYGRDARAKRVAEAGWLLLRVKNDEVWNAIVHLPWAIVSWGKGIVSGVLDPWTGIRSLRVLPQLGRAFRVRREVRRRSAVGPDAMWRWFV